MRAEPPTRKPECRLLDTDGNVFALAGRVARALHAANQHREAREFSTKLFQCSSYGEALDLMGKYVEVC